MAAVDSRHILFVLGMHRSGTSAACAALQACGAGFGSHLLDPMEGVNDEGFWEDAEVVQLNEELLVELGARWYTVTPALLLQDWQAPELEPYRERARAIIQRGFGDGPVEVVKDPRLCITLPLWSTVCAELGIATTICVINRAPIEVARSLQQRDGFPLRYGLHLLQTYRRGIEGCAPPDALQLSYNALLEDPAGVMRQLAERLPLQVDAAALANTVRRDLRHQRGSSEKGLLYREDTGSGDLEALDLAIAAAYPLEQTLAEFAGCLVSRSEELTRIGNAHTAALATLDERDTDLDKLSREHTAALATISERDEQIRSFDQRLAETGTHLAQALATLDERDEQLDRVAKLHTHALEVIRAKDEHLQRVLGTPALGLLFRAMWKHEAR